MNFQWEILAKSFAKFTFLSYFNESLAKKKSKSLKISPENNMRHVKRKPDFCIRENKDADQLRGNREADQRLCFRYIDSSIPLLSKYEITSL